MKYKQTIWDLFIVSKNREIFQTSYYNQETAENIAFLMDKINPGRNIFIRERKTVGRY